MVSAKKRKGGDELRPGQIVANHYTVMRPIAEGGMATIYLAVDNRTGNHVAIKCLYLHYENNAVVRARFVDEGRIQMLLQHPNIVRVYELVNQPHLAFVMEYIEGYTLEEHLQERGPLPMTEVVEVMIPVLSALGLAHSRGIIHRDLKPSNILITRQGGVLRPKVMDFGVAKLSRNKNLTATGTTVGTLHYMSPEQIVGAKNIDGRADIYSLGIILYKLCTGQVPFNASTEYSLMMAQVEAKPTPPSTLNREIHPELEKIILRSLNKRAQDRYQTIRDFTAALVALRDEDGNQTLESISVPAFILDYAIGADKVAIDRTEEVMVEALRNDSFTSRPGQEKYNSGTDTAQDLPMLDTGAITTERDPSQNQRISQVFQQQQVPKPRLSVPVPPGADEGDDTMTLEVDTGFLKDLRREDAARSDHPEDVNITTQNLKMPFEFGQNPGEMHPVDDDPTQKAPMDIASLQSLFAQINEAKTLQDEDPEANKATLQHVPLSRFADSREMTHPRPPLKSGPQSSPARATRASGGHPSLPQNSWGQQGQPRPDFGARSAELGAASSSPSQNPPKVVGPSYVDTRERTKPQISNTDIAQSFNPDELLRDQLQQQNNNPPRQHQQERLPIHVVSAQEQVGRDTDLNLPLKNKRWVFAGGALFLFLLSAVIFIGIVLHYMG